MTSKPRYDNIIQALLSHYNQESSYNALLAPVFNRLSRRSTIAILAGTGIAVAATTCIVRHYRQLAHKKKVERRIQRAQQRRAGEFDTIKHQLLSNPVADEDELAINVAIDNDGPYAVFQAVRERQFRLQDVVRVYQKRCIRAQAICNPITHMFVDAATQAAKLEDSIQRDPNQQLPPLYGLVFSVKEMYGVAGTDSTSGLTKHLEKNSATEDSVIVKTMRQMGAILLCKTNFPQTLFSFASSNPIYGVTRNPHNIDRIPGGSSSGEAVLQSLGCVMLGWGSDIAGSLREPGNFSGVATFKPIVGRFSARGVLEVVRSSKTVDDAYGMLSRDVRLIALVHKVIWEPKDGMLANDLTLGAAPVLWREQLFQDKKPLRIGYFADDGYFQCMPGVVRAVNLAASALTDMGHTLVPFEVPDAARAEELFLLCLWGDRLRDQYHNLKDEPIDESQMRTFVIASSVHKPQIGHWIRRQLALLEARRMSPEFHKILQGFYLNQTPEDLSAALQEAEAYKTKFLEKCLQLNLDVLLCPNAPFPPLKLGDEKDKMFAIAYVSRFNMLNLPAGAVPVTRETMDDQKALDGYPENDEVHKVLKESARGALGMPLGVQVVSCHRYQEEVALRVMAELQQTIGKEFVLKSSKLML